MFLSFPYEDKTQKTVVVKIKLDAAKTFARGVASQDMSTAGLSGDSMSHKMLQILVFNRSFLAS